MYATTTMEIEMRFHFTSGKKAAFTKCDCMGMTDDITRIPETSSLACLY